MVGFADVIMILIITGRVIDPPLQKGFIII